MIGAYEDIKVVASLDPIAVNATWNSTGVEMTGFQDALICVYVGLGATPLSTGVKYTLTFEESDSVSSGYTTISSDDIESGLSGTRVLDSNAEDNQIIKRGYKGSKKYVRVTGTLSGTDTSSTTLAVFVVLHNPIDKIPVTQVTEA